MAGFIQIVIRECVPSSLSQGDLRFFEAVYGLESIAPRERAWTLDPLRAARIESVWGGAIRRDPVSGCSIIEADTNAARLGVRFHIARHGSARAVRAAAFLPLPLNECRVRDVELRSNCKDIHVLGDGGDAVLVIGEFEKRTLGSLSAYLDRRFDSLQVGKLDATLEALRKDGPEVLRADGRPWDVWIMRDGPASWWQPIEPVPQAPRLHAVEPMSRYALEGLVASMVLSRLQETGWRVRGADNLREAWSYGVAGYVAAWILRHQWPLDERVRVLREEYEGSFPLHPSIKQAETRAERFSVLQLRSPLIFLEMDQSLNGKLDGDLFASLFGAGKREGGGCVTSDEILARLDRVLHKHVLLGVPLPGAVMATTLSPSMPASPAGEVAIAFTARNEGHLDVCGCVQSQSGGMPRLATYLREVRRSRPATVTIDAGGFTPKRNAEKPPHVLEADCRVTLDLLRELGFDVLVPAYSDLAYGPAVVEYARALGLRLVSCNVRPRGGAVGVDGHAVVHAGEVRVGIVGVTSYDDGYEQRRDLDRYTAAWADVLDPVTSTVLEVELLGGSIDVIVVVGQLPMRSIAAVMRDVGRSKPILFVTSNGGILETAESGRGYRTRAVTGAVSGAPTAILGMMSYGVEELHVALGTVGACCISQVPIELNETFAADERLVARVRDHYAKFSSDAVAIEALRPFKSRDDSSSSEYVGVDTCAACHPGQYRRWRETSHARAINVLRSNQVQHLPNCYVCHVTAFGLSGGYRTSSGTFEGVQCEACHGPGGDHSAGGGRVSFESRVEKSTCTACHFGKHSPNFESRFSAYWGRVAEMCRGTER